MTIASHIELRAIPGFDGYLAGSDGEIYSVRSNSGGIRLEPKRLKHDRSELRGYRRYRLAVGGWYKKVSGHRLVCSAFHGKPPSFDSVTRHLNGKPSDNRPENLSWGTSKENGEDKVVHGNSLRGEKNASARLNSEAVKVVRHVGGRGRGSRRMREILAGLYGVSPATIKHAIYRGWRHV